MHQVCGLLPGVQASSSATCALGTLRSFAQCTAKRRIIMIGDSLMRQQFQSLACLTSNVTVSMQLWDGLALSRL